MKGKNKKRSRRRNMSTGAKAALIIGGVAVGVPLVIFGITAAVAAHAISKAASDMPPFDPVMARRSLPISVRARRR